MDWVSWVKEGNLGTWALTGLAFLSVFKIGDVVVKRFPSKKENTDTDSVAVKTMIAALESSQKEDARRAVRLETLEARVNKLEERERHMLTRAAIHEAWDQMAFQMLLAMDPNHPPPPSLYKEIQDESNQRKGSTTY